MAGRGFARTLGLGLALSALLWTCILTLGWQLVTVSARGQETPARAVAAKSFLPPPHRLTQAAAVAEEAPPGYLSFCIRMPAQCYSAEDAAVEISLTPDEAKLMADINRSRNAAIRPMDDLPHYGRAEYWAIPTDGYGDCEDYALAKRQQLMAAGFPAASLRIALVRTWAGKPHAVLTVATIDDDLVLDSLTDVIRSWDKTDYEWMSRQDPGSASGWVSLKPAPASQPLPVAATAPARKSSSSG
jgi:predicted transglutaminase-like cysteine proteinase